MTTGPSVVSARFAALLENMKLTSAQASDGETKHKNVRGCLNAHYFLSSSETANSRLVGSWGKATRVRPPRDVDVLFELPVQTVPTADGESSVTIAAGGARRG